MIQLEKNEKIYLIKRRHPIVLKIKTYPIFFLLSLILVAIIFFSFFSRVSWPKSAIEFLPELQNFRLNFFVVFFLAFLFFIFWNLVWFSIMEYYLNCLIVTNKRIIQVEMKSLFNVSFSTIFHDKIQDIVVSVKGFLPSFFRFGDIQIETAGGFKQFIFHQIPEPGIIKQVILETKMDFLKQNDQNRN